MMPHTLDPATPALRPDTTLADAPLRIGRVTLVVHDLEAVSRFYEAVIGLHVLEATNGKAVLGAGEVALLNLEQDAAARRWSPREAGLFHTAFLLPTRSDLGAWLRHMAERSFSIAGASDHLVSEAVYLADPEGNGIEVYADRPSASWTRRNGEIAMSTEALDLDGVMRSATARWFGLPPGSRIGHVHLQAGELTRAGAFYTGLLGFDVMARYPGALFYGSGGYHHQLATNLWNSRGAPARTDRTTGLAEVELLARSDSMVATTRARLREASIPFEGAGNDLVVHDPAGNRLRLLAEA